MLDKREAEDAGTNRRRRECSACNKRFTTYERVEVPDLTVIKKDGSRERFEPMKLRAGVQKACEKRPVTADQVDKLVEAVEAELRFGSASEEVSSGAIGEKAMEKLRLLDKVAYIRFASVYKQFEDVGEFERALRELKQGSGPAAEGVV